MLPRAMSGSVLVVCAVLLAPGAARAEGEAPRALLRFQAPAACPDQSYVQRGVERLLGGSDALDGVRAVTASCTVTAREGGGFRLELVTTVDGESGTRTLDSSSCEELADAATLIIALAVNPKLAGGSREKPSAPPEAAVTAPPEAAPQIVPALLPPPPRGPDVDAGPAKRGSARESRSWGAGVSGALEAGALPSTAPGVALHASWLFEAVRLELSFDWARASRALAGAPSAGGNFSLYRVSALSYWMVARGRVKTGIGGGLDAAVVRAVGYGVDTPIPKTVAWPSLALGGLVSWEATPSVAFRFALSAEVPLHRPDFVLEGLGVLHRTPGLGGRGLLGVEARL